MHSHSLSITFGTARVMILPSAQFYAGLNFKDPLMVGLACRHLMPGSKSGQWMLRLHRLVAAQQVQILPEGFLIFPNVGPRRGVFQ